MPAKHDKTIQQVVLRWHLQEGVIVFPQRAFAKASTGWQKTWNVFNFALDAEDMTAMVAMDSGRRVGTHPDDGNW